ncbi:MAG: helix-turn-helix domain-containing protein [Hyphomicrobiales bacterium]|nr:helix-turn-helix domain-containing protein [Hyphomicrobiales bacterium]
MTPFGARLRAIRLRQGLSQQAFARQLGVSSAYVSALEHGRRGRPSFAFVQGVIHTLGVIWDEADELVKLAELSDPRVVIDTAGLDPAATLLANRLAREIASLDDGAIAELDAVLEKLRHHGRAGG